MRDVGTVVRGIRTPIIKEGDDLASIVVDSVLKACKSEKFELEDNLKELSFFRISFFNQSKRWILNPPFYFF